jgi:hypothetical protein
MVEKNNGAEPCSEPQDVDQYFVLIECADERQQVELLERFQREKLKCRALLA